MHDLLPTAIQEIVPNHQTFEKKVPFSDFIQTSLLALNGNLTNIQTSANHVLSYLAVQEQRRIDNPVHSLGTPSQGIFLEPTALEAYLYGESKDQKAMSADEIVETLAALGSSSLDVISGLHRSQPGFASRVFKVMIEGETQNIRDVLALVEADLAFRSILARLRARLLYSREGQIYRDTTRNAVAPCLRQFKISPAEEGVSIGEKYELPQVNRPRLTTTPKKIPRSYLNPKGLEGYDFLVYLGKVGHPLVRQVLPLAHETAGLRPYFEH